LETISKSFVFYRTASIILYGFIPTMAMV